MGETPRRLLLADTAPGSRSVLEPLARAEGWEVVSVDSSFQVLRTVRDANVDLVLIDPDLPGSGVSGADVAKTLKGATQFRHLPVLLLLHGDRGAPSGVPADGTIAIDRWGPARVLHTVKQALGLAEAEAAPPPPEAPTPAAEPPPSGESLLRLLTGLIERLTQQLEARLADLLAEQEQRAREAAAQHAAAAAREFLASHGPAAIREEVRERVAQVAERVLREVGREVVPAIAERLIAEELARLRREYGVE
jgi:CheY-like chemotaxis protein